MSFDDEQTKYENAVSLLDAAARVSKPLQDAVRLLASRNHHLTYALRGLVEHEDNGCRLDHHGYCQEHHAGDTYGRCNVACARELLGLDEVDQ